jgi:hypothetical protein
VSRKAYTNRVENELPKAVVTGLEVSQSDFESEGASARANKNLGHLPKNEHATTVSAHPDILELVERLKQPVPGSMASVFVPGRGREEFAKQHAIERASGGASRSSAPPGAVERIPIPVAGDRNVSMVIHSISQPAHIHFCARLETIFRETKKYIETLGRSASEGRGVDEANNFLRWLQFSGVCALLEDYHFVNVEFRTLRRTADGLQDICQPHLQGRNMKPPPNQSRIDEVNDKLDIILSAMAKSANPTHQTSTAATPTSATVSAVPSVEPAVVFLPLALPLHQGVAAEG